eukprot:CAMPEP_0175343124 /NCGR_PEP_ID=MMETSP0095-20121207/7189_1 /TAXON_ID=311494 /ORGANISM="Alexandrium monilatum, Strain CCMP3105" /LENGTH=143 /DNA_ID=CAMNT_0016640549 /DNA_START=157 /DNA_END=589 /DNA_ORIENTATION=-
MPAGPAGSQIREADAAVHADGLAVEVAIVDDVRGEQRKLLRLAETRRPGDRGQEPLLHLRRRGLHQGGVDDPRGDGHDADAEPGEVTAMGRVMPTTAPLDAEYANWPFWPSKAATEATLMITPRFPSASAGSLAIAAAPSLEP